MALYISSSDGFSNEVHFREGAWKIFKSFPTVEQPSPDKMVVRCQLSQAGDVYLSAVPKIVR